MALLPLILRHQTSCPPRSELRATHDARRILSFYVSPHEKPRIFCALTEIHTLLSNSHFLELALGVPSAFVEIGGSAWKGSGGERSSQLSVDVRRFSQRAHRVHGHARTPWTPDPNSSAKRSRLQAAWKVETPDRTLQPNTDRQWGLELPRGAQEEACLELERAPGPAGSVRAGALFGRTGSCRERGATSTILLGFP